MNSCGLYSTLIVSAVVIWQMFSIAYGDFPDVFKECHTAVVTVVTDTERGTGFCIDPDEHSIEGTGQPGKYVITASHVVKGAIRVRVVLYQHEENPRGNWKLQECQANIFGLDVVRDLAVLEIECDTCNCTLLGALRWRLTPVEEGDSIIIIGDSTNRAPHSFVDGKLSVTYLEFCPASVIYNLDKDVADRFVSRAHGLIGCVDKGDSGSPVMDIYGAVFGMILAKIKDLVYCLTKEEIEKAYNQILNTRDPDPYFVGCAVHESALLGRVQWGRNAGFSIKEMNALANAMNAQYFAIAHGVSEAYAFTLLIPWWEMLPGYDEMEADEEDCSCNKTLYIYSLVNKNAHSYAGQSWCGCADHTCRMDEFYDTKFGDRRWAIYKVAREKPDKNTRYVPSNKSLHVMKDIIDYWKEIVHILNARQLQLNELIVLKHESEKANLESEYRRGKGELVSKHEEEKEERKSKCETEKAELVSKYDTEKAELVSKYGTEKAELVSKCEAEKAELISKYDTEKAELVSKYDTEKTELISKYGTEKAELVSKYDTEKAELVSKYGTEKAELVSNYERERDELVAKYKSYGSIMVAVLLVASSIVMYLYKRLKNAERMLKETNTARDRSRERLSQQDVLQNPSNSPAGDSNAGEGPP